MSIFSNIISVFGGNTGICGGFGGKSGENAIKIGVFGHNRVGIGTPLVVACTTKSKTYYTNCKVYYTFSTIYYTINYIICNKFKYCN